MPIEFLIERFDKSRPSLATDLKSQVAAFNGGDDLDGQICTEWIQCTGSSSSALQSMRRWDTEVFLYRIESGGPVVGYGSLGLAREITDAGTEIVSIIPSFCVDVNFHHKPDGVEWHDRYSGQIMIDLIRRASRDHTTNTLILYVRAENKRARLLYERLQFRDPGIPPRSNGYLTLSIPNLRPNLGVPIVS